jgi:hypothetical protein
MYTRMRKIQYIRSFEEARKRYESIKPIRGREGDSPPRPLSDREAVDTYNIRKRVKEGKVSYECYLYGTPVLTYTEGSTPNGDITINMGDYPSVSTRAFVSEIIGLPCAISNGTSYITLPSGKVVLPRKGPTVVRKSEDGKAWELVMRTRVFEIQLQREEAKVIRAQYKEFTDYVDNVIKLRREPSPSGMWFMRMEFAEFKEATLPEISDWSRQSVVHDLMFRSIATGGTENFYKAFLLLVASSHNVGLNYNNPPAFNIRPEVIKDKFKELLYKHHSKEVFKKVELPLGKIPSKKYNGWV